jgi:predicted dehydrogenase
MVRTHPQWLRTRELIRGGRIGELRTIAGMFSYSNRDAANVRNVAEWGGGALMDIGCYPITMSRFIFDDEPNRVVGLLERDPEFKTDRLTSVMMDFTAGQATFTCSTQLIPYQRMQLFGTKGRIELEIPFNAPVERPTRILVDLAGDIFGAGINTEEFAACNQYTIQGDFFSRAVRGEGEAPVSLEEGIKNMEVIEAVFRSAETGKWEKPESI